MTASDALPGLLAIAFGGALGALLRAGLARACAARAEGPSGAAGAAATLAANLLACLLLGALTRIVDRSGAPSEALALVAAFGATGLCGSLSTFSTLCGDAVRLGQQGATGTALLYLLAHLLGGPIALWLGSGFAR